MLGPSCERQALREESGSLQDGRTTTSSGDAGSSAGNTCGWAAGPGVLVGALALVASLACGEDLPVVARGRYVEIATDRDEPVCAGTVAHIDRFIEGAFEVLGETPPDRIFVRSEWPAHHDGSASARIDGDRVVTRSPLLVHEHELMHAVHLEAWPRSASFMHEGLAVLIEPHRRFQSIKMEDLSRAAFDEILGARRLEVGRYPAAWFIVSQIVYDHGIEGLRELWHRVPWDSSTQQVRDAYFELFDRPIDALVEPWIYEGPNGPSPIGRMTCSYTVCAGEPHAWDEDRWLAEGPAGCEDDPHAVGSDAQMYDLDVGSVWRDYLLERTTLIEPPRLSGPVTAMVIPCGFRCPYDGPVYVGPDQLSTDWGGLLRVEVRTPLEALPIDRPGTFELQHYHEHDD
jgi:hypothetical protein